VRRPVTCRPQVRPARRVCHMPSLPHAPNPYPPPPGTPRELEATPALPGSVTSHQEPSSHSFLPPAAPVPCPLAEAGLTHPHIINVALPAGVPPRVWRRLLTSQVLPRIAAFKPDLLLVSAGFDAHHKVRDAARCGPAHQRTLVQVHRDASLACPRIARLPMPRLLARASLACPRIARLPTHRSLAHASLACRCIACLPTHRLPAHASLACPCIACLPPAQDTINCGYVSLREEDYEWVTHQLMRVANTCCQGACGWRGVG
jgi:hypothetical protein